MHVFLATKTGARNYMHIWVHEWQNACRFLFRCYSQLGTNPIALQLGTMGFLHEPLFNKLASVYNDSTHDPLKSFVVNHAIYVTSGVQKEAPATFDQLSVLAVLQGIDFINKQALLPSQEMATTVWQPQDL